MTFEASNAVIYFPDGIETHEQKRQYRVKKARQWNKALLEADKFYKAEKKKMLKTLHTS